ncbi:Raf-like protein [Leptospira inadai serovar Lyme str. 10]|uniref:Raf-like protein n=2 Tax=Leptospira inadai serovar Lyme TaxID=293084 RepID=V6HY97_9LEPT|nr:YbhB/YbcL family Raf kinase inhibitor-like protein [Leptospira inadai]EQA37984.1 Raf-like protein [Leptospira inadai serovar Lyme str. 10]PNV73335.1 YbhB/YbcL family Raf kinase inhibitor-like protein [Leptospira inadai serovar Lyme]
MRFDSKVVALLFALSTSSVFAADLKVSSSSIKEGGVLTNTQVFNGFGCSGDNVSPDLHWTGAPKDTKFFAVTVYDPDAPTGSGWWHWVVFNIPADVTSLDSKAGNEKGTLPKGAIQSRTDFGKPGYGGPCPPAGDKPHKYIFRVIALKDKIPLDQDASGALVGFYINSMKLADGKLTAKYGRK